MILLELMALISYQDYHILLLLLAGRKPSSPAPASLEPEPSAPLARAASAAAPGRAGRLASAPSAASSATPGPFGPTPFLLVLGSWGKTIRDALRNKEWWKRPIHLPRILVLIKTRFRISS